MLAPSLLILQLLDDLVRIGELIIGRQPTQAFDDFLRGVAISGSGEQVLCSSRIVGFFDVSPYVLATNSHELYPAHSLQAGF